MVRSDLFEQINQEIAEARSKYGALDAGNSRSDWINFICRYASGASPRLGGRRDLGFREAMMKVAALAVSAIEAEDGR